MQNTDDCFWAVDTNFMVTAFNEAYKNHFFNLFGKYPSIGSPDLYIEFNPLYYQFITECYRQTLTDKVHKSITQDKNANGAIVDVEYKFMSITKDDGSISGIVGFRRDITEYQNLIRSLEKLNDKLKDIAWVQSHKLRGPLTTIKGLITFLHNNTLDTKYQQQMLSALDEKVKEMDLVIREIVTESESQPN